MNGIRIKMCAKKNSTPFIEYSDPKSSDVETFINSDAHKCFTNYFIAKSVHSKIRFIYNMDDDDLGLPDDFGRIITSNKWRKFCKHPNHYNMQIVIEFYSNMANTSCKRMEVIMRQPKFNILNRLLICCWGEECRRFLPCLLETIDEQDLDVLKDSLSNPGTKWKRKSKKNKESKVKRMRRHNISNIIVRIQKKNLKQNLKRMRLLNVKTQRKF